uniref:Nephrin n=2 Tax=Parascaris univalens TaxID=6257 RepID=A0A915A597_PARUN
MLRRKGLLYMLVFSLATDIASQSSEESPFIVRPKSEPYYVSEGEQGVVLECSFSAKFSNKSRYESSWTAVAGDVPRHLTRNEVSFMKSRYDLLADDGQYNLRIKRVELLRDNGKFYCTILDKESGSQKSVAAVVIVVVAPDKPVITRQPSGAIHENELVSIECQSSSGNPPPSFSWIFNNNTVVPEGWHQERNATSPNQPSFSLLQWRAGAYDNDAYLSCRVWNQALPKGEYKSVITNRLSVLYGPRVQAGPVPEYNVEEGERVELTCTADGNPPPSQFEWYHLATGERFPAATWQFVAEKRHAGDFRCTAINSVESGVDKLTLNVLYGPILKVKEVLNPAEGDSITLECVVDANPAPDSVSWSGPNGIVHKGPRFTIDSVTKSHSGNYTCSATNTLTVFSARADSVVRSGQAVTLVDVLRRPGRAAIIGSSSSIVVGGHAKLTCRVDDVGSPQAEYRWASPATGGTYGSLDGSTLTVEHATITDNGEYRCMPHNKIGDGEEGVFILQVIEPAKIIRPLPDNRVFNAGEAAVSMFCEAQGYPAPIIKWRKDGNDIISTDESHWYVRSEQRANSCSKGEVCTIPVVSTLKFAEALLWNDKGNYSCIAENGVQDQAASSWVLVNVIHEPVILNERYPTDALAAADVSSTAHVSCLASSRPRPKFIWMRNSTEIRDGEGRYAIRTSPVPKKIDEYESILTISDLTEYDHGPYLCRVANGLGSKADVIIKLQSKAKPQSPRDVRLISFSSTWLLVGWRAGFNGGAEQQFQFEYRKVNPWKGSPDGTEPTTITIEARNASTQTVYWQEGEFTIRSRRSVAWAVFTIFNMTNLTPQSTYWLRLRARNVFGESDWTPITTATTADVVETSEIPRPHSLFYNADEKAIYFEASESNRSLCLMLFVSTGDDYAKGTTDSGALWRTVDCFTEGPIADMDFSNRFKARLCYMQNISLCSESSDVLVSSAFVSSGWKYAAPAGVGAFIVVLFILLLIICYRTKHDATSKTATIKKTFVAEERRPVVSAPLPQSETKNTIVHGSQTDSGIFTLGSLPNSTPSANQQTTYNQAYPISGGEAGVDNWCTNEDAYDYSNDPYLCDYNNQFITGHDSFAGPPSLQSNPNYGVYFDGFTTHDGQPLSEHRSSIDAPQATMYDIHEDSDETSYTANGSRRVMREIIV